MGNHKKRKNLVCSTTAAAAVCSTTTTVCSTTTTSADKDLSSASHAPVAKRCHRRSYVDNNFKRYGTKAARREEARDFCSDVDLSSVLKYHIQPGVPLQSWPDRSFEITWVAVHGKASICVVARSKDLLRLDMAPQGTSQYFAKGFWNTIISEVEDIAEYGESRQKFKKRIKKPFYVDPSCSKRPFGVVSVIKEDNNEVHKASCAEYDAEKAIEFLREEMESGAVFTFNKTTKTAVSAFQHLFRKEFEADEIRVFVLKYKEHIGRELKQCREDFNLKEILAVIHGA